MISAIQAEELNASIWLRSDGLSFATSHQDAPYPASEALSTTKSYLFSLDRSLADGFRECIYQHPHLALPYHEVRVYYTPASLTLVPLALYEFDAPEVWLPTVVGSKEETLRPYELKEEEKVLLGSLDRELTVMLERTYMRISFIPMYAERLQSLVMNARTAGSPCLLLWLNPRGMTFALADDSGVRYINTFNYVSPSDERTFLSEVIYYLSLVSQALALGEKTTLEMAHELPKGHPLYREQERLLASLKAELKGRIPFN